MGISDTELEDVKHLVAAGRSIPAIVVRAIIDRLEEAEAAGVDVLALPARKLPGSCRGPCVPEQG